MASGGALVAVSIVDLERVCEPVRTMAERGQILKSSVDSRCGQEMEARLAALPKAGTKRRKATWEKYRYTKQELLGLVAFNSR